MIPVFIFNPYFSRGKSNPTEPGLSSRCSVGKYKVRLVSAQLYIEYTVTPGSFWRISMMEWGAKQRWYWLLSQA